MSLIRIVDASKSAIAPNGKPYVFTPPLVNSKKYDVDPRCARDLINAGVAEKEQHRG